MIDIWILALVEWFLTVYSEALGENVSPSVTWPSVTSVSQVLSSRCVFYQPSVYSHFPNNTTADLIGKQNHRFMNPVLYLTWTEPGPSMHYGTTRGRYAVSRKMGIDEDTIHRIRYHVKGRKGIKINLQKMDGIT
jgi:hypothetical protein